MSRVILPLFVLLLAGGPADTGHTQCITYNDCGAGIVGRADVVQRADDVVVHAGVAYIGCGTAGLATYDLTDPTRPVHLATLGLGCYLGRVALAGDVVCVAGATCGAWICDVADPAAPTFLGHWNSAIPIEDVAAAPGALYVAEAVDVPDEPAAYRVRCIDVNDPLAPVATGWADTVATVPFDYGVQVHAQDGLLFLGTMSGLRIYDVTDPLAPVFLADAPAGGHDGLAVEGSLVYVGRRGAVYVVDITEPTVPVLTDGYSMPAGEVRSIGVQNGIAFLGTDSYTLEVVDFQGGTQPVWLDTVYLPAAAREIVAGQGFYLADGLGGLLVADAGDGTVCGTLGQAVVSGAAFDLVRVGDMVHSVADLYLETTDVGDPVLPSPASDLILPAPAHGIASDGERLFVAAGTAGLHVAGGAGTAAPYWFTSLAFPAALKVAYHDGYCWLVDSTRGLCVVDVTNSPSPVEVASLPLPPLPQAIDVAGDRACVGFVNHPPYVIDISDPFAPTVVDSLSEVGNTADVIIRNDVLLVAERAVGLRLFDLATPGLPGVGTAPLPANTPFTALAATATTAYLGRYPSDVFVIDFAVPSSPYVVETVSLGGAPRAMAAGADVVCAATSAFRVTTLPARCDVSALPTPVLDGVAQQGQRLFFWAVPDDQNYVETCLYRGAESGLQADEPIGCSAAGFLLDTYEGRGYYVARHRDADGRLTLASNEIVFAAAAGVPPRAAGPAVGAHPNPFNPATTITITTPTEGPIACAVFDLRGRRVAEVFSGWLEAGMRRLAWSGVDADGRALPSGTYVLRVTTPTGVASRSVTLLK